MNTPLTLDGLRAITNPVERIKACLTYTRAGHEKISAAVRIKDEAVTELLDQGHSVHEISAACGISASQVKMIRRLKAVPR